MNRFPCQMMYAHVFAVSVLLALIAPIDAEAKTPGKTNCYNGVCHRVLSLTETSSQIGHKAVLSTSNYDDCRHDRYNPCGLTSSGAAFQAGSADNAASPIYPDGTIVLVRYPQTQKSAVLRINNAGPYYGNRLLDVSKATAEALGFAKRGVANLEVQILQAPTKAEATYRRNRVYPAVPGYLGAFASLEGAATRYASLAGAGAVAVASIYPQLSAPQTVDPAGVARTSLTGNGIERTWLASNVTFKPARSEAQLARKVAARLERYDERRHRGQNGLND